MDDKIRGTDGRSSQARALEEELQWERRLHGFPSLGLLPFPFEVQVNDDHLLQETATSTMASDSRQVESSCE